MPSTGSFLQRSRHDTTYYFRRRVPRDLRSHFGQSQLYRTLGTTDRRVAMMIARKLAVITDRLFAELREMAGKSGTPKGPVIDRGSDWASWGESQPSETHALPGCSPGRDPEISREAPLQQDPQGTSSSGVEIRYEIEYESDPAGNQRIKRISTEPGDADDRVAALEMVRAIERSAPSAGSSRVPLTLEAAAAKWLSAVRADKAHSTWKEYTRCAQAWLLPSFGPQEPVSSLTQERFAKFASELHATTGKNLAVASRNQILASIAAFSSWLASQGLHAPALTTKHLSVSSERHVSRDRKPFTMEQVGLIFRSVAKYKATEPAKFWITVASAFFGGRVEELAQLDLTTDFRFDDRAKLWILDFNERLDADGVKRKSLKKNISERATPVHDALVRHGFMSYLQAQRDRGFHRPFEDLWRPYIEVADDEVQSPPKWSHAASKWGGRELNRIAAEHSFDRSRLTFFHSHRHTVSTQLSLANVPEQFATAYQGHKPPGSSENRKRYGVLNDESAHIAVAIEPAFRQHAALLDEALGRVNS